MQLGLEKLDLNTRWLGPSLLKHRWGGRGPATPGIPPPGLKGSPTLLAKAGIKEMTEERKKLCILLPCPRELCPSPTSAPPSSHTSQGGFEGPCPPQPPSALPLPKKGAQRCHQPPPDLTCGCSPSLSPRTARQRPTAIPEPPCSPAGLTMAGDAGRQRVLAAVPRDCPHLAGASQLHSPPSQPGVIRMSF